MFAPVRRISFSLVLRQRASIQYKNRSQRQVHQFNVTDVTCFVILHRSRRFHVFVRHDSRRRFVPNTRFCP